MRQMRATKAGPAAVAVETTNATGFETSPVWAKELRLPVLPI
jgi:hypothetical protein